MKDYNIKFEIGDLVEFNKKTNPDDAKFNPWKVKRILIHDDNLVSYDLISDRNLATTGAYGDVLKIHVKKSDKDKILHWCDSVQKTWNPREELSKDERPILVPEQFLATSIRYLRALCEEEK
jgi:hypothetical protein